MADRMVWFARVFDFDLEVGMFPNLVERLRGTPARLEERVRQVPPALLTRRVDGGWSIQENVGHLGDLEPLWAGRLDDLLAGKASLRPADLENRKTHEAGHNARSIGDLLRRFRSERQALVARLEQLTTALVARSAMHPRLERPMRTIDMAFFVAEHDDHHLAAITALLRGEEPTYGPPSEAP